ncbi:MAG: ribose 5-phosphate isomerase B [Chitinispirillales bacterium]|jgi:ribose 5-phosphate isomerase B|nr:ribose 5-phosphate isomerase B [Chitinispirillales bacterium]
MENAQKICVAGDHAGFEFKENVKKHLVERGFDVYDCGALSYDVNDDYPVFAMDLARKISSGEFPRGILFCGAGIGVSIAANRHKGVRAALCFTPEMGALSRLHNDSNVLVLGARITPLETSLAILDAWLAGKFEGGRHEKRVKMLDEDTI